MGASGDLWVMVGLSSARVGALVATFGTLCIPIGGVNEDEAEVDVTRLPEDVRARLVGRVRWLIELDDDCTILRFAKS